MLAPSRGLVESVSCGSLPGMRKLGALNLDCGEVVGKQSSSMQACAARAAIAYLNLDSPTAHSCLGSLGCGRKRQVAQQAHCHRIWTLRA